MGTVVPFIRPEENDAPRGTARPSARPSATPGTRIYGPCQLVLFPGIRIERHENQTPSPQVSAVSPLSLATCGHEGEERHN